MCRNPFQQVTNSNKTRVEGYKPGYIVCRNPFQQVTNSNETSSKDPVRRYFRRNPFQQVTNSNI